MTIFLIFFFHTILNLLYYYEFLILHFVLFLSSIYYIDQQILYHSFLMHWLWPYISTDLHGTQIYLLKIKLSVAQMFSIFDILIIYRTLIPHQGKNNKLLPPHLRVTFLCRKMRPVYFNKIFIKKTKLIKKITK